MIPHVRLLVLVTEIATFSYGNMTTHLSGGEFSVAELAKTEW